MMLHLCVSRGVQTLGSWKTSCKNICLLTVSSLLVAFQTQYDSLDAVSDLCVRLCWVQNERGTLHAATHLRTPIEIVCIQQFLPSYFTTLSRVKVTIRVFWIDSFIYWTFLQLLTAQVTITHRLVSGAFLGSGFQQWMFLCFCAHVLAGWRPSHVTLVAARRKN